MVLLQSPSRRGPPSSPVGPARLQSRPVGEGPLRLHGRLLDRHSTQAFVTWIQGQLPPLSAAGNLDITPSGAQQLLLLVLYLAVGCCATSPAVATAPGERAWPAEKLTHSVPAGTDPAPAQATAKTPCISSAVTRCTRSVTAPRRRALTQAHPLQRQSTVISPACAPLKAPESRLPHAQSPHEHHSSHSRRHSRRRTIGTCRDPQSTWTATPPTPTPPPTSPSTRGPCPAAAPLAHAVLHGLLGMLRLPGSLLRLRVLQKLPRSPPAMPPPILRGLVQPACMP